MDVVIRLGVRIEMHWPLFSIGTLQLNSSQFEQFDGRCVFAVAADGDGASLVLSLVCLSAELSISYSWTFQLGRRMLFINIWNSLTAPSLGIWYGNVYSIRPVRPVCPVHAHTQAGVAGA